MTAIKKYYEKLNETALSFEVPEWDKVLHVGPLTFSQWQKIEAAEKIASSERAFAILEHCAKDSNGSPAFGVEELKDLRLYGQPMMITKAANALMEKQGEASEYKEDAAGN